MIKAIIEIPKGSKNKYEIKDGVLTLDRIINIKYPANYGFIPNTLWYDGDALDVFVIGPKIHPTTQVDIELLGVIKMLDNGISDYKLIARIKNTSNDWDIEDIKNFLHTYKSGVNIQSHENSIEALKVLKESRKIFKNGNYK